MVTTCGTGSAVRFVVTADVAGTSSGTGVDSLESLDIFDMEVGVSGTGRLNISFLFIEFLIALLKHLRLSVS